MKVGDKVIVVSGCYDITKKGSVGSIIKMDLANYLVKVDFTGCPIVQSSAYAKESNDLKFNIDAIHLKVLVEKKPALRVKIFCGDEIVYESAIGKYKVEATKDTAEISAVLVAEPKDVQ